MSFLYSVGLVPIAVALYCGRSLWQRLARKSQTTIDVSDWEELMIVPVFVVLASIIVVLAGVTDMTEYTAWTYRFCVIFASVGSCAFLFFLRNKSSRFRYDLPRKRKGARPLQELVVMLIIYEILVDGVLVTYSMPWSGDRPSYLPPMTRLMVSILGPSDTTIAYGSLFSWIEVYVIVGVATCFRWPMLPDSFRQKWNVLK